MLQQKVAALPTVTNQRLGELLFITRKCQSDKDHTRKLSNETTNEYAKQPDVNS